MDTFSGSLERITYYNPDNGYTILRLRPDRARGIPDLSRDGLATVVGVLPELNPGEHLKLKGRWVNHPKYGGQFNAEICEQTLPATVAGIKRYLGSGLVKGVGPKLAERIVNYFGSETLEIIDEQPQRLRDVPDIGPKRTRKIALAWDEQRQVKEIMLFLHSHEISTNLAVKIYKTYGDAALSTVQENPYQLARDIYGVGFITADKIARDMGLPHDHPSRIEAGIIYALNEMSGDGHVYAPQDELTRRAIELLEVPADLIPTALDRLAQDDRIRPDILPLSPNPSPPGADGLGTSGIAEGQDGDYGKPVIYLTPFYFSEKGVAERLGVLNESLVGTRYAVPLQHPELSSEQQAAIQTALTNPVSVLTGGPGTGKTTCLKALIADIESQKKRYALASPTGRAAKRLSEATDRPASTIHRLLGYSPMEGFKYHAENPLPIDFLVLDETSMLDLILANNLLKALKPGTHLLLVGDVDQLPSVGAGDVLRDVIASGTVPVTRLTQIFRQAAGSLIITNAHKINAGEMPVFSPPSTATHPPQPRMGDFFLFPAEDAAAAADWLVDVVTERIPDKFGFDPLREIQVLAPMYRGPAGVRVLNERLQEKLNAPHAKTPQKRLFGNTFRPGDKVMQIQNNYDKDVFNGDIGFVTGIGLVEHILTVEIDGRRVDYNFTDADQLVLAYAVTVHKAQGSEFPVVVMPLVTAHYMMLQRNLLYTAITRAKTLCVLVGGRRAIGMAVKNNKVAQRHTALDWRLQMLPHE
ncbi:ATP-dependent RecD-like DNA helicase, partial [Chloroflexota bacterium]